MTHPNKIKHVHRFDNAQAVLTENNEWSLTGVTYQPLPCGCTVTGGGVLPGPLTVTHCPLHTAAPALYALAQHVEAMTDDAYLQGHPEWVAIAEEAYVAVCTAEGRRP